MYKFSLILCTINRVDTIKEFMEQLSNQEYMNFELIIVDQNLDDRLNVIIDSYKEKYKIIHIKSERGLSKARNKGLKYITGDIIAFPDDDCIYPKETLRKVNEFFNNNTYDILSIKMTNSIKTGRKIQEKEKNQEINRKNIMKLVGSISLFIKSDVVNKIGGFNEDLGLGSHTIFQGGEDYDYPLRAIKQGCRIYYNKNIEVLHPWDDSTTDKEKRLEDRAYNGGAAEMYILNIHEYGSMYKICRIIRRIIIIIYYLIKLDLYKAKLSYRILQGMIQYYSYRNEVN